MSKVLKLILILILITTSVCFGQKRRSKKHDKQQKELKQEGEEEEYQETEENTPKESDQKDSDYDEEEEEGKKTVEKEEIQGENPGFRPKKAPSKALLLLENFHFNFSSGYGLTSWKSSNYIYDVSELKYRGLGLNVPFHLQLLYQIKKVRFGGGASYEFYFMEKLKPNEFEETLPEAHVKGIGTYKKFYGHLGYKYFETKRYACLADLEIGVFKGSRSVNTEATGMRPFVNAGITMERKYSEYFRMFIKPSIEYKTQPFQIPVEGFPVNNHRLLTLYFQWGVSYSIPVVRKCPIKACGIRIHHYHGNQMFRGNPFHRLQNPNYGEEDRKFIRLRGKNKKKLDPY